MLKALRHTGGSNAILNGANFKPGCAYVLVGVPYWGEGNGLEFYAGSGDFSSDAALDVFFDIDLYADILPRKITQDSSNFDPFMMAPWGTASAPGLYLTPTVMGYYAGAGIGWTAATYNNGAFFYGVSGSFSFGDPKAAGNLGIWYDSENGKLYVRGLLIGDDIEANTIKTDKLWVAGEQITADGAASKVYEVTCGDRTISGGGAWIEAGRTLVSTIQGRKYVCYGSAEFSASNARKISISRDSEVIGRTDGGAIAAVDTPGSGAHYYIMWIYASNTDRDPPYPNVSVTNIRFNIVEMKV